MSEPYSVPPSVLALEAKLAESEARLAEAGRDYDTLKFVAQDADSAQKAALVQRDAALAKVADLEKRLAEICKDRETFLAELEVLRRRLYPKNHAFEAMRGEFNDAIHLGRIIADQRDAALAENVRMKAVVEAARDLLEAGPEDETTEGGVLWEALDAYAALWGRKP